jgi:hypothetical protein
MNDALFESLLNEDESSYLDFKRDQYLFIGATDDEKGKLLKDILAFANAWRRTDAYILIGVEDVQGGRSKVVGITSHFDDAKIQQFVNSKTNRPITFSYLVFPFEGVQVGIIYIPIQERPIYLNSDFGKLKKLYKDRVYIRRGSSTDYASPDEISKMGLQVQEERNFQVELSALIPELDYFIGAKETNWHVSSRHFPSVKYQRLIDVGIIARLDEQLQIPLQDVYAEIRSIDRLIEGAWGGNYNVRTEALNEVQKKFPLAKRKAEIVRDRIKKLMQSFN